MATYRDIIDLWPTITDFVRDVNAVRAKKGLDLITYERAKSWRRRGSIRVVYWDEIIAAARSNPIVMSNAKIAGVSVVRGTLIAALSDMQSAA